MSSTFPKYLFLLAVLPCTLSAKQPPHKQTPKGHAAQHRHRAALADATLHGFTFHNRTVDLSNAAQQSCSTCIPDEVSDMQYTAARQWPTVPEDATAAIILAVQLRSSSFAYLRAFWHTWAQHALPAISQQPVLIIMTEPAERDGDDFLGETIAALQLHPADCQTYAAGCQVVQMLELQPFTSQMSNGQQALVLIGNKRPKHAWWLLRHPQGEQRETAKHEWRPVTPCIASYDWARHTQWYAYEALQMPVLDFFDFFFKIDSDIFFTELPLEETVVATMARHHRLFMHTQEADEPEDCVGPALKDLVTHYIDMESERCQCARVATSQGNPWFERPVSAYYANFVGGWLGFFTAPEVMRFATTWWNWPHGAWDYRWTDQQYWTQVLGMFARQSDVEDMSFLRAHFHHKPPPDVMGQEDFTFLEDGLHTVQEQPAG